MVDIFKSTPHSQGGFDFTPTTTERGSGIDIFKPLPAPESKASPFDWDAMQQQDVQKAVEESGRKTQQQLVRKAPGDVSPKQVKDLNHVENLFNSMFYGARNAELMNRQSVLINNGIDYTKDPEWKRLARTVERSEIDDDGLGSSIFRATGKFLGEQANVFTQVETAAATGAGALVGAGLVVATAPVAATVAAGAALGAGIGWRASAMSQMYRQIHASTYNEFKKRGFADDEAWYGAQVVGILGGALELVGVGRTVQPLGRYVAGLFAKEAAKQAVRSTKIAAAGKALKEAATIMGVETATELGELAVEFIVDHTIVSLSDDPKLKRLTGAQMLEKTADTVVESLKTMALIGPFGGGLKVARDHHKAKKQQKAWDKLHQVIQDSEDKLASAELVSTAIVEDGHTMSVRLDGLNLAADADPTLIERLGITDEQLADSEQDGSDVALNQDAITAVLTDPELFAAMAPHLILDDANLTSFEADRVEADALARQEAEAELARLEQQAQDEAIVQQAIDERNAPEAEVDTRDELDIDLDRVHEMMGWVELIEAGQDAGQTRPEVEAFLAKKAKNRERAKKSKSVKLLERMKKSVTEEIKKARAFERQQIEKDLLRNPARRFLDMLSKGDMFQIEQSSLEAYYNPEALDQLPKVGRKNIWRKKSKAVPTFSLQEVAAAFDMDPQDFVNELVNVASQDAANVREVELAHRMAQKYPELFSEEAQIEETLSALMEDNTTALLIEEANLVTQYKDLLGARERAQAYKAAAKMQVRNTPLQHLSLRRIFSRAARLGKEAGTAIREGKPMVAAQKRLQQAMVAEQSMAIIEAKQRMQAANKWLKKYRNPRKTHKGVEPDAVKNIQAMLEQEPQKDATFGEWMQWYHAIRTEDHRGRTIKKIRLGRKRVELKQVVAELHDQASHLPTKKASQRSNTKPLTALERGGDKVAGALAAMRKVEAMTILLDGGSVTGPWRKAIYQPIADAWSEAQMLSKAVTKPAIDALTTIDNLNAEIIGPNGQVWTKSRIVGLVLHTGNLENLARVADANGLEIDDIWRLRDELSVDDMKAIQKVWDSFQVLWPRAKRLAAEQNGIEPLEVESNGFEHKGEQFRGGYYPIAYDTPISEIYTDDIREIMSGSVTQDSIFTGMLQDRTAREAKSPVNLDVGRVPLHLNRSVHYITHLAQIENVKAILDDPQVREDIKNKLGEPALRQFEGWLGAIASDNRKANAQTDLIDMGFLASYLQRNITISTLGGSISTLLAQPLGMFNTFQQLATQLTGGRFKHAQAVRYLVRGMRESYMGGDMVKFADTHSKELPYRVKNVDAELVNAARELEISRVEGKERVIAQAAMEAIGRFQLYTVDRATWIASYRLHTENGFSHQESVDAADSILRQTQSGGALKDMSAVQRSPGWKLLFIFGTWLLQNWNNQVNANQMYKSNKQLGTLIANVMYITIVPALVGSMMVGDVPEEDDEIAEWIITRSLAFRLGVYPIVGTATRSLETDAPPRSLGVDKLTSLLYRTGRNILNGDEEAFYTLGILFGTLRGVPMTGQIDKTTRGLLEKDPTLFDMVFGPKK